MVEENELVEGQCYFLILYHDKDLRIPDIRTMIFIGKNIDQDEKSKKDLWFFQDPESYLKYGASIRKPRKSGCEVSRFDENSLFSIYDWSGMINELTQNKEAQDKGEIFD